MRSINDIPGVLAASVKLASFKDRAKAEIGALVRNEKGLSTMEYAVLFVIVVAATVGLWRAVGDHLVSELSDAAGDFESNVHK